MIARGLRRDVIRRVATMVDVADKLVTRAWRDVMTPEERMTELYPEGAPPTGPPVSPPANPAPAGPRYVTATLDLLAAETGLILGIDTAVAHKDAIIAIRGIGAR